MKIAELISHLRNVKKSNGVIMAVAQTGTTGWRARAMESPLFINGATIWISLTHR